MESGSKFTWRIVYYLVLCYESRDMAKDGHVHDVHDVQGVHASAAFPFVWTQQLGLCPKLRGLSLWFSKGAVLPAHS